MFTDETGIVYMYIYSEEKLKEYERTQKQHRQEVQLGKTFNEDLRQRITSSGSPKLRLVQTPLHNRGTKATNSASKSQN